MQIRNENTAISFLSSLDNFKFATDESTPQLARLVRHLQGKFPKLQHHFKEKIQYLSQPLLEEYLSSLNPDGIINGEGSIDQSGTIIRPIRPLADLESTTILYQVRVSLKNGTVNFKGTLIFFNTLSTYEHPFLLFCCVAEKDNFAYYVAPDAQKRGMLVENFISDVVGMLFYLRNSPYRAELISTGEATNYKGVNYQNLTTFPLEVLFSSR